MDLQEELGLRDPFSDFRHEAVLSVVRTANLFSTIAAQLFRRFDLTEAQFNVLFALRFSGDGITQAELGKRLVVTRASITSVLDKLEDKGLVRREKVPENRRIYHILLTPEGTALVEGVEPEYRSEVHRILGDLGDEDCRMLINTLERTRVRVRGMLTEAQ